MTGQIPTSIRAAAIVDCMTGAKPAEVAEKVGVTTQTLRAWRDAIETDAELRVAVQVALRAAMQGWRPRVAQLVVRLVSHVERLIEHPETPTAIDAETSIGAIRALASTLGQVDIIAARHGADDDDEKGPLQ